MGPQCLRVSCATDATPIGQAGVKDVADYDCGTNTSEMGHLFQEP